MKNVRLAALAAAALLMAGSCPGTALARPDHKIDKVQLEIRLSENLDAGDPISDGVLTVKSGGANYEIKGYSFSNGGDSWKRGDRPRIIIDLEADEDYYFSSSSKSYFSISGDRSPSFAEADRYDSYDTDTAMEVTVSLRSINTGSNDDGPSSDQIWWDDNEACWDEIGDADRYEVRLYRNGSQVTTVTEDDTSHDFTGKMTKRGDYTFRVRAKYSSSSYGSWSDFSDELYVSSDDAEDNADDGGSSGGPGGSSGSGNKGPGVSGSNGSTLPSSGWMQNAYGWWYRFSDGTNPANSWQNINYNWYYFANSGYMQTGWLQLEGSWYYLRSSGAMIAGGWYPVNGLWYYFNADGRMQTGWLRLNNVWYYLLPSGAMATGWNNVNEIWYFMDAGGAMYANAWTPDGHYVDGSGARVQ